MSPDSGESSKPTRVKEADPLAAEPAAAHAFVLKRTANWLALVGTAAGGFIALFVVCNAVLTDPMLLREFLRPHLQAIVGIPMAALSAYCVVMILEARSGRIEFEGWGFKFRGASGPVVLWVVTFLAFSSAIRLLW